ncbi:hypothetical protein Rifp1Sym_ca00120 [endosymbiont of Riftia pachyptila (vent Ph05)]|uniref:Uncharacterized protein n=2 Tax=sulfur-oxidizing symbionts TaxID=32036 RepID=G2FDA1_9GAMM|nr:hypothetical protein Rifp1Sym_ca00120 [endosymbiont of Riftia pachyptila (vent Ph05)]EGW55187.1 hypothetical protein TevJSym_ae00440 [endosymbiont of Tevnia jerichonana (vent Tica)]
MLLPDFWRLKYVVKPILPWIDKLRTHPPYRAADLPALLAEN